MKEKSLEQYMNEMNELMKRAQVKESVEEVRPVRVVAEPLPIETEPLPMDAFGSLIVVVNSALDRPLLGATVEISSPNGEVLYSLITDQSGRTSPVRLPAPLKENSLEPGNGEIVYGLYNIKAYYDGYVETNLENIPIFDSVVSIQQIRLISIAASNDEAQQSENEGNPYTL